MFRPTMLTAGLIASFGFGSSAVAWSQPAIEHAPATSSQASPRSIKADHSAIDQGNRKCWRRTGILIPPKRGECINAVGSRHSTEDLRRTGELDTARALHSPDPSIRLGH